MVLYKYCSATSAFRILEDMRLKVALPNECNDPFECTPFSRNTLTADYLLERARQLYDAGIAGGAVSGSFSEFSRVLPKELPKQLHTVRKQFRQRLIRNDLGSRDEASLSAGTLCL